MAATIIMAPILYLTCKNGYFISSDCSFHIGRLHNVINALKDGQILPQLDPNKYYGYGFASQMFYAPLAIYFITFIRLFIHNEIFAMTFFEWAVLCSIGVLVYNFTNQIFTNQIFSGQKSKIIPSHNSKINFSALIAALLVMTSACVITPLYYYIAYSQLFSCFFLLLLLISIYFICLSPPAKSGNKTSVLKYQIYFTISMVGLITGHAITLIISCVALFILCIFMAKRILAHFFHFLPCVFVSLGLTSWFVFPLIENLKYTGFNINNSFFKQIYS